MTLIKHEPTAPDVAPAPYSVGGNLIREAAAVMADAHTLAKAICHTQMVPKHFQGKPDECAAAMLYGASLGLDPMQAVKAIYVVHGQAALYARAMVALVVGGGHRVWTVESTDDAVTVAGQRAGSPHVEQVTWDTARAKKAGYTSNAKYQTDPQAMLYAKAASEVCRKVAPDVLAGVYAVEELRMERWDAEVTSVQPTRGLRAALASHATAEQEPPERDVKGQRNAMFAAFHDAGFADAKTEKGRADRLSYVAGVIGREVESTNDMTWEERSRVIDALKQDTQEMAEVQAWEGE